MDLDTLFSKIGLKQSDREAFARFCLSGEAYLNEICACAYEGAGPDFPLCKEEAHVRLFAVMKMSEGWYKAYEEKGVEEAIILDTLSDISLRADLYEKKTGDRGLSEDDITWFRHLSQAELFKIGPLQYQPFQMLYLDEETLGHPYMNFPGKTKGWLLAGEPVINCHVPKGAELSEASLSESISQARAFFLKHYPDTAFQVFLCYSWLLYPAMVKELPLDSGIRAFQDLFCIVGACDDRSQAEENLERKADGRDTILTALYEKHPEKFGFACGIIPIDD